MGDTHFSGNVYANGTQLTGGEVSQTERFTVTIGSLASTEDQYAILPLASGESFTISRIAVGHSAVTPTVSIYVLDNMAGTTLLSTASAALTATYAQELTLAADPTTTNRIVVRVVAASGGAISDCAVLIEGSYN